MLATRFGAARRRRAAGFDFSGMVLGTQKARPPDRGAGLPDGIFDPVHLNAKGTTIGRALK
jgi:hypothetical protein